MKQVTDFFSGLFATDQWPARWKCGNWTEFHGWLYIISDLMIWLAYFLIPIIIIDYFIKKRDVLQFKNVYFLFAAFILLCGSTHFLDALMFWTPAYRFSALVRFVTGIVSLLTVFYLVKVLPDAFRQKTSKELEMEIAKRQLAEKQLSEANQGLQAFAYIASHDLQEPLRKIKTFTSLLQKANADKFDAKSSEYAGKIVHSSAKMQSLIEDVLTLSSIENEIAFKRVKVANIISAAAETLEIKIAEKNAVIHQGEIPDVWGNEAYLCQLFTNLLSNSLKFSNQTPHINISGHQQGNAVVIRFSDNGVGMDQNDTERIFQAFSRLHTKAKFEGSGIGLAICKKIIEAHHGKISVISEIDNGTTFIIELLAPGDDSAPSNNMA
jgi:two-component system, chemotaxis family, sensor kinase Cph1